MKHLSKTLNMMGLVMSYEVNPPWKPSPPMLPDNFTLTLGRSRSLTKPLQNNPKVFDDYSQIIAEQDQSGIIERVDIENSKPQVGETNYLPHREVIKEDRTITKTRIVYDGSAKLTLNRPGGGAESTHRLVLPSVVLKR